MSCDTFIAAHFAPAPEQTNISSYRPLHRSSRWKTQSPVLGKHWSGHQKVLKDKEKGAKDVSLAPYLNDP